MSEAGVVAIVVASVAALATVASTVVQAVMQTRMRGEVQAQRVEVQATRALAQRAATSAAATEHEVKPNSGSSMADGVARIEAAMLEVKKDIGGLRSELRTEREERGRTDERLTDAVRDRNARIEQLRADIPELIEQHVRDCPLRRPTTGGST